MAPRPSPVRLLPRLQVASPLQPRPPVPGPMVQVLGQALEGRAATLPLSVPQLPRHPLQARIPMAIPTWEHQVALGLPAPWRGLRELEGREAPSAATGPSACIVRRKARGARSVRGPRISPTRLPPSERHSQRERSVRCRCWTWRPNHDAKPLQISRLTSLLSLSLRHSLQ